MTQKEAEKKTQNQIINLNRPYPVRQIIVKTKKMKLQSQSQGKIIVKILLLTIFNITVKELFFPQEKKNTRAVWFDNYHYLISSSTHTSSIGSEAL